MSQTPVAAITGAGGVLCSAMARALGAQGYAVAVLNRTPEKGEAVAQAIVAAGGEARAFACNVLDHHSLIAARDAIVAWKGGIDVLVNGAGGNDPGGTTGVETHAALAGSTGLKGFFDLDPEAVGRVLDLNFLGTFLPCQVFGPALVGRPGATIINISSMGSFQPMTKVPAYCAAKAAVNNLTNWLAVHFASSGVRVNAIAPGFFSTEQNKTLLWNPDGSPTARTKKILDHTPLGRLGAAEDLVGTLLWLANPETAGFVTGAVIPVDGGFLAYSGV